MHHHRVLRAMSKSKTTVSVDSERERRCRLFVHCLILVSVILLVYNVASTIYIILLSQKLDTLERLTMTLKDRADKMEDKLSARTVEYGQDQSKNTFDRSQGKASLVKDKSTTNSRRKRQFPQVVCPCAAGKRGPRGRKGRRGEKGLPGTPGLRGPPGPVATSEMIHLVGDGSNIQHPGRTFVNWRLKHRTGSIVHNSLTGHIEVRTAGYYFIYSQMYYYSDSNPFSGHYTYINNNKVLESVLSPVKNKKQNTKFHGGVFQLSVRDRISVRPMFVEKHRLDKHGSYFGAFLLYPTSQRQTAQDEITDLGGYERLLKPLNVYQ